MSDPNEPDRGGNDNDNEDRQSSSALYRVSEHSEGSSASSGDSNEQVLSDGGIADTLQEEPIKDANGVDKRAESSFRPAEDNGHAEREHHYARRVGEDFKEETRQDRRSPRMASPSRMSWGFKLPDGRYRPPETEEEWNAFYQE